MHIVTAVLSMQSHLNFYSNNSDYRDIDCKRLLKDKLSIDASEADCKVVKRVCEAVSKRAARLAATGVVALVDKIKKLGGCTVAVDGSLYEGHPKFAKV